MRFPLLSTLFLFPALPAVAATLVTYDIPSDAGTVTVAAAPTIADGRVEAASLAPNGSFGISTSTGTAFLQYNSSQDSLAGAISDGDYLRFSVTITAGNVLDLTSIAVNFRSEGSTGGSITSNLSLFASVDDNFTTAPVAGGEIGTITTNSAATSTGTFNFTDPAFEDLSGQTIYFRLYGFDNSSNSGSYIRVDNITVNGDVIPEPGTTALLAVAGMTVFFRRRRSH